MFSVALTGGIGCGKTTVCQLFSQYRAPVIDTDIIARQLVEPGQAALTEIVSHFGTEILHRDGSLNRQALATLTFSYPEKRRQLESILHPAIRQLVTHQINSLTAPYVIIAIPLLFETAQQSLYDRVLVIDCDEQQQIHRTQQRDHRDLTEIKAIMSVQISRKSRLDLADDIINNTGDVSSLETQVNNLHQLYLKLASA